MAKFNEKSVAKNVTTNYMGEKAYIEKPEMELVSMLLTSFMEDSYYEKSSDMLERMRVVLGKVDAKFAAKAAIYARNEFGMRSVSHVLSVELLKYVGGQPWGKSFFESIVRRPDDMTEIIAYYFAQGNKKLPAAIKKGFAKAFNKFDRYQISKYKGKNKNVSLVDVVNLVHPLTTKKNGVVEISKSEYITLLEKKLKSFGKNASKYSERIAEINASLDEIKNNQGDTVEIPTLDALMVGLLKNTETLEAKLSKAGQEAKSDEQKAEMKTEVWKDLFKTKKMPYMALLKNLRNILEQAPELVDEVCEMLVNRKMIENSLVLPFRFLSAYEEVGKLKKVGAFEKDEQNIIKVLAAIDDAIKTSVVNLPTLYGKTVILSDNSGSMTGDRGGNSLISRLSNIQTSDIANLFAVLYWLKADNTLVGLFGDNLIYPRLNRNAGVFENFKTIDTEKNKCGAATERGIFEMFEKLIREKTVVDSIVVFSDCQIGNGCKWYDHNGNHGGEFNKLFNDYKKISPKVRVYSVDLKGYGTNVFSDNVYKIFGWSDKIFDIMKVLEQDKNALIKIINEYAAF